MKLLYSLIFFLLAGSISAQETNRQVLVEHFTNTYCSNCAGRNPALYGVMEEFGNSLHHITYFPSVPYNQCPLYNYNPAGNGARQNFYGILATPTLYVNGLAASSRADGFRDAVNAQISQTARLLISVEETTGSEREVAVSLTGQTNGEFSDFRLFVALVERNLEFAADNGETEHFNVFRKMLTANGGDQINVPGLGETTTFDFTTNVESSIAIDEAYILAYVQDLVTGEILGSGTRFDEATTGTHVLDPEELGLTIFPNPTQDRLQINVEHAEISSVKLRNLLGEILYENVPERGAYSSSIDMHTLPSGTYMLSVHSQQGVASLKVVRQ